MTIAAFDQGIRSSRVDRLCRVLRLALARVGVVDERRARLREIVRAGAARGLRPAAIAKQVAAEMYHGAIEAGAYVSDLGLFGPWLYERDAATLVAAELDLLASQHPPRPS